MKKKNFLKLTGFFISLFLITQSCRNESLALEQDNQKHNYNISVLDKEQFESKTMLFHEITNLKSNFFKPITSIVKTVSAQDSILGGAIIETDRVLEITDGTNRTYTFPVSRTFSNDKVENLILRENPNKTYSGVLIQYSLTKAEKEQYANGLYVNLNGKIKTFTINNISISGKGATYSYYEGCWEYVYESNPCTAGGNHSYGDGTCDALGTGQAAQPSQLIAAYNHCGNDGGSSSPGGSSSSGSSGTPGSSGTSGSGSSTGGGGSSSGGPQDPNVNPYNTFLFLSFDDRFNVCAEGDAACEADRQLNIQIQQYLMTLSPKTSMLASYNPILFTIKNYFLTVGYGDDNLTDRLNLVANWFKAQNNTNTDVKLDNFKFANFTLSFLIQNPNASWEQFENWFMGISEGKADEDYDAAYWNDPNLIFPPQNLPSWQNYYNGFPKDTNGKGLLGPAVYNLVGGVPKAMRDGVLNDSNPNNDRDYDNACALRVSKALNYSGIIIPNLANQTFKGGDGKYYFLSAKKLNAWMRKTFGTNPATTITPFNANHIHITGDQAGVNGVNLPSLLGGKKGIYSLVSSNSSWASGHGDILQPNGTCINGCHFYDAPIAFIDIWQLQ
jgi:uncharacterized membrane protein YgcG